ncbi:DUF3473 domain-containing protein [Filimonas effusa]|uniref:DUF3473 domain-containing protein n=1 Tax=Filimonas effusa TaxID=2508721 RepID=A0A4Q1DCS6_9BACT|nr:DUF3473 domain-containing protein [Filimonas effusa]RXK87277.1 DUF3473 domain-containing protein [Filimonas effusa]
MSRRGAILLSFDVEEFDLPMEYGQEISTEAQLETGKKGLDAIMPFLSNPAVPATLFTTAFFATHFPGEMKALAATHEIASHTFHHSSFCNSDLLASRIALEGITGTEVRGLRMPRMQKVDVAEVLKAGYSYDSSINPTIIPGRYNNRHLPRTIYGERGLLRIPASVSPVLRLPLFWLGFKNYPYALFRQLAIQTLKKDGYLCLYFHPWEFTDLQRYRLPAYIKRYNGDALVKRLTRLTKDLAPHGRFMTTQQYLESLPINSSTR